MNKKLIDDRIPAIGEYPAPTLLFVITRQFSKDTETSFVNLQNIQYNKGASQG